MLRTLKRKDFLNLLTKVNDNEINYNKIRLSKRGGILLRIGKSIGLINLVEDFKTTTKKINFSDVGKQIFQIIQPFINEIKKINKTDIAILFFLENHNKNQIQHTNLIKSLWYCKKTILNHVKTLLKINFITINEDLIELTNTGVEFLRCYEDLSDLLFEKSSFKHGLPELHYLIINNLIEAGILHILRHNKLGRTTILDLTRNLYLPRDTILRTLKKLFKKRIIDLSNDNQIISSNNLTEQYQLTLDILVVSDILLRKKNDTLPNIRAQILEHLQILIDKKRV